MVISKYLPSCYPAKRDARRRLPSRGSLGPRFPTFPGTLPASVVRGVPYGLMVEWKPPTTPGPLVTRSPTPGICSRRQVALPRSRVPLLKTCPALRPRWCPAHLPWRTQDCCLPVSGNRRLSPHTTLRVILLSTTIHISGSITRPAFSLPPASYGPLRGGTRVRS